MQTTDEWLDNLIVRVDMTIDGSSWYQTRPGKLIKESKQEVLARMAAERMEAVKKTLEGLRLTLRGEISGEGTYPFLDALSMKLVEETINDKLAELEEGWAKEDAL